MAIFQFKYTYLIFLFGSEVELVNLEEETAFGHL